MQGEAEYLGRNYGRCVSGSALAPFDIVQGARNDPSIPHGVDIADSGAIMAEKIALMEALWRNDIGSYRGDYVSIDPSWSCPRPIQRPRPPIQLGARAG
ncbi:MAG: LLM class flavin-dependent oxidoreductase [Gammaproteobacteria bacterium]|nr:MAG: LLM class flavin-dependent oxidoreductase [Gammaproteobacteria bacterium]